MLCNIIGPVFNFKICVFCCCCFFCLFYKNPLLSVGRMIFSKRTKMDQFLTLKRAKIGPVFDLTIYIYICAYACRRVPGRRGPVLRPHLKGRTFLFFGPQKSHQKDAFLPWYLGSFLTKHAQITS